MTASATDKIRCDYYGMFIFILFNPVLLISWILPFPVNHYPSMSPKMQLSTLIGLTREQLVQSLELTWEQFV